MASSQNDDDSELDAMLRQAALLEAQMKSSSSLGADQPDSSFQTSGSSQPGGEAMSLAYSEDAAADDMLLQAELLAAKMRNKSTAAVEDHASVDDMLYKAELLALKMKAAEHSNTPPPRESNTTATTAENTPALIRHSERLLSKMHHGRDSGDMPTPELMRRTEHLLDKMKASAHAEATEAMEHLDQQKDGRSMEGADDILSRSEALLAHARAASLPDKQDASMLNPPTHHDRSDELKRLMEEALSKWSASSGEDTGRVKDALEHILPTLGSHTPSTVVSVPPREPDDMSSVGSMSPKSLPKSMFSPETIARSAAAPRTSPHRPPLPPPQPHNVDVAVEMAQKMALALHETPPEESFEAKDAGAARNGDTAGVKESKTNGHSKATLSPEQAEKDEKAQLKAPGANETSTKASNDETQEHVQSRQVPSPPRMDPPAAHSREPANGKPSPPKTQRASRPPPPPPRLSSEEAQYNAIMNAIDSAPTADTSWEKVESATEKDDDYVPLADYSRKAKFERYSTSSFLEIPTVDRITEFRRRRKSRLGRRIVFMVLLAVIAWWGKTYWLNNESTVSSGTDRGVEESYVDVMDEPAPPKEVAEESLPVEEPVEETFPPVVEPAVREETVHVESERKVPKAGSRMARGVQKALVKFVVSLTPPWERFCELDSSEACRNTKLLMDSMGNS